MKIGDVYKPKVLYTDIASKIKITKINSIENTKYTQYNIEYIVINQSRKIKYFWTKELIELYYTFDQKLTDNQVIKEIIE